MMTSVVFLLVLLALLAAGLGWRSYLARQRAWRRTLRRQRHIEQQKAWDSQVTQGERGRMEGPDQLGD